MTREEAAKRWEWAIENFNDSSVYLWPDQRQELLASIALLRDPQPDPITGLVPCGCGCEPELRNEGWGWYQVYCTGCDMHGGNSHTPDGVIEEWNTAMGWREGNEN